MPLHVRNATLRLDASDAASKRFRPRIQAFRTNTKQCPEPQTHVRTSDTPNPGSNPDPRVVRTRERIIGSFNSLVFTRPYEDVSTGDIIDEAGVGKSTFYEHFRGKDELLCEAASGMLATLAAAIDDAGSACRIRGLLEHFAQVWSTTRSILRGPAVVPFRHTLADLIEARLALVVQQRRCRLLVPGRLVAMQVAEAQFSLFTNWLEQLRPCSSEALAESIVRTSRAMVECQLVAGD